MKFVDFRLKFFVFFSHLTHPILNQETENHLIVCICIFENCTMLGVVQQKFDTKI